MMASNSTHETRTGDIAVIGMSCRFPGNCGDVDRFWHSISSGDCAWSEIPQHRFHADAFWSPPEHRRSNTSKTKSAFFLKHDIAQFDAAFFTLSKAEALAMDPQQRLLIEVAYEAIESAGLPLPRIAGSRTGVFVGVLTHDYYDIIRKDAENMPLYTMAGNQATTMAGRLSWLWDLRGPCLTLDTACSSSLVALHMACQSIRVGESDMAIVGGTNLMLSPDIFTVISSASLLAPDGKSKAFDASGDGYGRGEGIGALALKRVEDAVGDGDPIRAVIRGTSCNQDGHTRGLTLPDWRSQAELIRDAYRRAELQFEDTGYVEAHGTGTQTGDVEETKSISTTIAASKPRGKKLLIGSVKSNIGHSEGCAGLASMIKAVLVLEHGLIPPTITVRTLNPKIPLDEWKLMIPNELVPFPEHKGIRRVSVNGFGFAGTNAHVVLDDAFSYLDSRKMKGVHGTRRLKQRHFDSSHPTNGCSDAGIPKPNAAAGIVESALPLLFSHTAQDRDGVIRAKKSLADYLHKLLNKQTTDEGQHLLDDEDAYLVDLAHTLNTRRSPHKWRTFTTASSILELIKTLRNEEDLSTTYLATSRAPRIGFVFTGQGAQWAGMGMELMAFPIFAESICAAGGYLKSELGCEWSAEEELRRPEDQSRLGVAEYSQALCTILQVALVDLLRHWGIEPTAITGHSSGEIAAAYCLGALTREDAWKVAFYRGILTTNLKSVAPNLRGAMMAVGISTTGVEELIEREAPHEVTIACINSPSSVTLSGDVTGIDKLNSVLTQDGIFARKLQVDTAYHHARHMQVIASDYLEAIMDIQTLPGHGSCTMYSSCAGAVVQPAVLGPTHWIRNLVSPVMFARALQDLVRPPGADGKGDRAGENAIDVLVEIGPHAALRDPSLQSLKAIGVSNVPYISVLMRREDGVKTALAVAGHLHACSLPVHLEQANEASSKAHLPLRPPRVLIGLPSYSWNHSQRYWAETRWAREQRMRRFPHLSLLGAPTPSPVAGEHAWRGYMRLKDEPWIADHKIHGATFYPGAGLLAMAIEAAMQVSRCQDRKVCGFHLRHVQFTSLMAIRDDDNDVEFSITLRPHQTGTMATTSTWTEFVISSSPDGKALERNCLGLILVEYEQGCRNNAREATAEKEMLQHRALEAQSQCSISVGASEFYSHLSSIGLTYGPAFSNISAIGRRRMARGGQSSCVVHVPDVGLDDTSYSLLGNGRPHISHPALLDAVFHMAFAAMDVTEAWIPKSVDEVIISMDVPWSAGEQISGFCDAREHGMKEFKADIIMQSPETQAPVVRLLGLCFCTSLAGEMAAKAGASEPKSVCGQLDWKPAVSLLNEHDTIRVVEAQLSKRENKQGHAESALARLSGLINLMHHEKPGLILGEVVQSNWLALPELDIDARVFGTTKYRVYCAEDERQAIHERLETLENKAARYETAIIEDSLVRDADRIKHDLLIAAHLFQADHPARTLEGLIRRLGEAPGSLLCLIDSADTADQIDFVSTTCSSLQERFHFRDEQYVIRILNMPKANGLKTNAHSSVESTEVIILTPSSKSSELTRFETKLVQALDSRLCRAIALSWDQVSDGNVQDKTCISLVEFDEPLLEDLSQDDFTRMKQVMLHVAHLTWLTGTEDAETGGTSAAVLMTGVLRTLRNEIRALQPLAIMVDKSTKRGHLEDSATLIADIFCNRQSATTETLDHEIQIRNGIPHICRVLADDGLNETLYLMTHPNETAAVDLIPIGTATDATPAIELTVGKPGLLDSTGFEAVAKAAEPLDPKDIEIAVAATGLNFREVMTVMGLLPAITLGLEAAGTVTRVGSAVEHIIKGERVAMLGTGAHSTLFRGRADYAFKIPGTMSFEEGASLPVTSYTAWYSLVYVARAQKGQSVLIHAGAGGVGQAALQIARHLGLEVFTTVGSAEKRALVCEVYGVAEDNVFGSRDLSFAQGVKRMTRGRGVDIVINSLAGEFLRRSWECIAPGGHFIEIGLRDIVDNTRLDMAPFRHGATFSFFDLKEIWEHRQELMADIVRGTTALLVEGIIKPATPLLTYPISEIEEALRLMQSGRQAGKIVLQWKPEHIVPVLRSVSPPINVDNKGVYLLAGGLGGLGRSLAKMLVADGAKKLCFLNRSGTNSKQGQALLAELRDQGVQTLAMACDISSASSLSAALSRAESLLEGPIRGCFQCAMALHDALIENMRYADWIQATRPKIQGSRNLSDLLPDTVNFFVMLSSFCGIFGNRGQANYVAGCAFQDALAHARRAQGKHAVSIDLGSMREVGRLAEEGAVGDIAEWEKVWGIQEHEFLALMRLCMTADKTGAQLPTGFGTRAGSIAGGIEPPYYFETDARFGIVARVGDVNVVEAGGARAGGEGGGQEAALSSLITRAQSVTEAALAVLSVLMERLAKIVAIPPSELDSGRVLHSYGVDSLAAVDIVNWLWRDIQARISVMDVMAAVPMRVFSERVVAKSALLAKDLLTRNECEGLE